MVVKIESERDREVIRALAASLKGTFGTEAIRGGGVVTIDGKKVPRNLEQVKTFNTKTGMNEYKSSHENGRVGFSKSITADTSGGKFRIKP